MENYQTFLLGVISGLLAYMLIRSYITVLKSKKEIATLKEMLQSQDSSLVDLRNDYIEDLSKARDEIANEMANIASSINTLYTKIEETKSYTDSRLDKTIDTLCSRMDYKFDEVRGQISLGKTPSPADNGGGFGPLNS